jgi:KDO2-lipid IV(A) lauroyltransferase
VEETIGERLLNTVIRVLERVPTPLLAAVLESLGSVAWAVDRRHRRYARINLGIAFPGIGDRDARRITHRLYRGMGTGLAELIRMPKMDRSHLERHIRIEGVEHLERSRRETDLGCILMTGHFGNWELFAHALSLLLEPISVVARSRESGALDRAITERRKLSGNRVIRRDRAARAILLALRGKTHVGVLIDQDVPAGKGVFVPFFGVEASTTDGMARLALSTGANIHPAFFHRDPERKFRHVMRFGPAIPMDRSADREAEIVVLTARCNEALERTIRIGPSDWMWIHRRWKTRPPGQESPYPARKKRGPAAIPRNDREAGGPVDSTGRGAA